jgi:hypothetical protein
MSHEFKFDLMDYLTATPGAPVASLGEILDLGLHHEVMGERFERRNRPEARDSEEYREALAKREELSAALLEVMNREGLDALAYPGMRRRPAPIGEPQPGSSCQVSAGSGFPAMAIPAGFTESGLPVGLELLGRPLEDARLVAMAYAFERAVQPRRPPPTTPALIDGRPPPPVRFTATLSAAGGEEGSPGATLQVDADFIVDVALGHLEFTVEISAIPAEAIYTLTLNRADDDEPASVVHRLLAPGQTEGNGTIDLGNRGREDLLEGRLWLVLYSEGTRSGELRTRLELE